MSGALPRGACDCHCHVFGPAARFPYAEPRSYTPDDAPLEAYLALLDRLGFDRGVLVQPSAYGRDNRAMLDALTRRPERLRGVAVGGAELTPATLKQWHTSGVRGVRANEFRRDGKPYYQNGVGLKDIETLLPAMADLGWHLQLWIDTRDLPDLLPALKRVPVPVVVDHMGRMEHRHGTTHPGFQALLRGVGEGHLWSKLSGTYRLGATAPDYMEAKPFHDALVAINPQNLGGAPTGRIRGPKARCRMPSIFWICFSIGRRSRSIARRSLPTIRRGCTTSRVSDSGHVRSSAPLRSSSAGGAAPARSNCRASSSAAA